MLGLGSTVTTFEKPFSPDDINNLVRWFKCNTGIQANADASGTTVDHTTDASNMADGDQISRWVDQTGGADARQATADDKPHWEVDELGAVKFDNTADMTFTTVTLAENTDFTIIFRLKPITFSTDVLISDGTNDFLRFGSNANIRAKIGGAGNNNFNDGSNTISTSVYSTIIFVRSSGSDGVLNIYVKPSNGSEIDWASGHGNTDSDELTLSMIGAESDDSKSLDAFVKDILIYNGTAITEFERKDMYSYLETQTY